MLTSWISDLAYMFRELGKDAGWYIFYWIFYNYQKRITYWNRIVQDCNLIADKISHKADDVVRIVEDWAKARYDAARNAISGLWDSITSLWGKFGYEITNTGHSVVSWVWGRISDVKNWATSRYDNAKSWASAAWSWVASKGTTVWDWIRDNSWEVWSWIRDLSGEVWDWIRDKSGTVWTWITGKGTEIETWYDQNHKILTDLFIEKREELATFLDDPGRYIADWVVDLMEYIFAEFVFRFW